jgi:CheY-like chemotaxis protein
MSSCATKAQSEKCRVLIVDDNVVNQRVLAGMLRRIGDCDVDISDNGLDALNQYIQRSGGYDLVLMDCEMPVMNGFDATIKIRQFEREHKLSNVPIIAVTAYAYANNKHQCLDAGMDEFLAKPVRIDAINEIVHRRCGH